ncbi:MAG: HAD family phosphatase [Clostridia bacterium]|nr:HAD family phosphatase [Clostridia bacterium]
MKDIKAVIFDMDGTLIDSMWIWKQIDIDFLGERGHEFPEDLQKEIEGMSFTETAGYFKNRFNLTESLDELKSIWTDMAIELYRHEIGMKPGATKFLELMDRLNLPMGIGTSNSKDLAVEVLERNKVITYFKSIRTSCEVEKGKPSPDVFLKVADDLGVPPESCLVFEDTVAGAQAGKNAGMRVIGVMDALSIPHKAELLKIVERYIESYEEIMDLFE